MGAASQELTERAKLLISERRYQEAVRACRRALLSQPEHVELRLLLGEALLALERYDEVRVEMMALARKAPLRGEVHRLLGEAYLRDQRPAQAVEALRQALRLDPDDEVASELLTEAANENAPVSTTIERWFADEAEATVETESPAWEEDHTGPVPTARPATAPSQAPPPTIQVDPSLAAAPPRAPAPSAPDPAPPDPAPAPWSTPFGARPAAEPPAPEAVTHAAHHVRSRKATALGFGLRGDDPFGPPRAQPRPDPAPPGGFGGPPATGGGGRLLETNAALPSNVRPPGEPSTEELDLLELESQDEVDLALPGEPTRAHVPPARANEAHQPVFELEDFDGEPTSAFSSGSLEELTGEPMNLRAPIAYEEPIARFEAPPDQALLDYPPAPAPFFEPIAEPDPPPVAPGPPPREIATERVREEAPPRPAPRPSGGLPKLLLPILGGVAALVLVVGIGSLVLWLVLGASEVAEVRERAAAAGDSGSRAAIEAVIEEIDGSGEPELVALEARLLATLTLEHDAERGDEARARIAELDGEQVPTDAAIATALLSIEGGQPEAATRTISGLPAEGESIAEGYRTSALANYAMGRWDRAAEAAQHAFEARPTSARHLALYALAQHRQGRSAEAITLLEGHPGHATHPGIRVHLAQVLQESTRDPERAAQEATAVIEEMAALASPVERSVAHLVRATRRAEQGDGAGALADARAAAEHPPAWDPHFGVQLVEAFLRAGAGADASRHLLALRPPAEGNSDALQARALLSARVALAVNELERASQSLATAGTGTQQSLLRAQIFEAQGRAAEARPLYESAMNDPGPEGRRARVRLASIAMRQGDAERAIELLEPAHGAATDDLELVPLLARAYIAEDRASQAQSILETALRRRPGAAELLAARGALELHRGEVQEALASLRHAAEARPEDADVQADLGHAARRAGDLAAARTAFDRAIELRASHPRALVGLARLAIAANELDQAARHLDAAAATRQEELEVARLRGEVFVARGDGALGIDALTPLARRFDDAHLWAALGDLQAQAELDRDAGRSFDRALRADRNHPHALLGRSLIQMRRGSIPGAASSIDDAEAEARRRGLGDELAPRIAVARGRIAFEQARFDRATELANQALGADPRCAPAQLLLANVQSEQGRSPLEALRAAVTGNAPPPEAVGRLAARVGRGDEACRLAARYMQVAPRGYDAEDVREVQADCD